MIGLFGGTFDPIHKGHIHLAKALIKEFPFTKILFIPNSQNPLKKDGPVASNKDRIEMIQAALKEANEPKFELSTIETDRPAPSFMIDTLELLKKKYTEELVLILGNEAFAQFEKWKEPKKILESVSVLIIKRDPNVKTNIGEICEKLHISSRSNKSPWIKEFVTEILDFSSTKAREDLKDAWNTDNLQEVPPCIQRLVCLVIKEKKLYSR